MNTDPAALAKELREIVGRRLLSLYGDAAPISKAATLLEQVANTTTAEEAREPAAKRSK